MVRLTGRMDINVTMSNAPAEKCCYQRDAMWCMLACAFYLPLLHPHVLQRLAKGTHNGEGLGRVLYEDV